MHSCVTLISEVCISKTASLVVQRVMWSPVAQQLRNQHSSVQHATAITMAALRLDNFVRYTTFTTKLAQLHTPIAVRSPI